MEKFPNIKNAKGILSCQESIIKKSYNGMIQRNKMQLKSNDKVL